APARGDGASARENGGATIDAAALEPLLQALVSAREGDFSVRLSSRRRGIVGELAGAYNDLLDRNRQMAKEMQRIRRVIGQEGRMTERASVGAAGGTWEEEIESVNTLIDDLVRPTTEVARVIDAVADGDLTQ